MVKLLIINLLSRFLKYKKLPVIRQTALTELTSTAKVNEMLFFNLSQKFRYTLRHCLIWL
jgi:hypothetical protein